MADNLRHWQILCKTDPKHTKEFSRAGGFKGKAIKPIYTVEKMTAHFGPCGIGWGYTKPEFTVQQIGDVALVFCSVGLWYMDGDKKSDLLWGEGGDYIAVKRKDGRIDYDDEGFKKAQTDALGNAMKLIGMSADVHMGQHEDDKYVRSLRQEFAEGSPATTERHEPTETQTPIMIDGVDIPAIMEDVAKAKTIPLLATWINENAGMLGDIGHKTPHAFDALAEQIFRHALSLCKSSGDIATWVGCKARGVVTGKMSAPVFEKMNDLVAEKQAKLPKKAA